MLTPALETLMMSFAFPLRGQLGHEWGAGENGFSRFLGTLLVLFLTMPFIL